MQAVERAQSVRIGVVRTDDWDSAEPCMRAAVDRAADLLGRSGATVSDVALPQRFTDIVPDFSIVNGWEGSIMLELEIRDHLDAFNMHNRKRVEFVRGLTAEDYQRASQNLDAARVEMNALLVDYDVFISPSLPGEAPVGLTQVRGGNFARLWTQMHTPAVNLPLFAGPNDLPVCFQVIGPKGNDDATLAFANWIDGRLREVLGDVPAAT
jgi:amidase